jgi:hypothetical protein
MVEVFAETTLACGRGEILIRGCKDPNIHRLISRAADPADRPLLDHLKELGLKSIGQEPHLVEKDRPAVGDLEESDLRLLGVGECSALVAEQLRLEQGLGDGCAIDVNEGAAGARTRPVQPPSEETLACPRFTVYENGREAAGLGLVMKQPPDLFPEGLDPRAVPD